MKTAIAFLLLNVAVAHSQPLLGQDAAAHRVDGLEDCDCFDAVAVGDVVYVYRDVELPDHEDAVTDLTKLISVDRAARHGSPAKSEHSLIEQMLGMTMEFSITSVSALNFGDAGFVWKVEFTLHPKQGGSSGTPWQYTSYVTPDGSLIRPARFLCACQKVGSDHSLFSVLSFEDLARPLTRSAEVDGEEALKLAKNAVADICDEAASGGMSVKLKFDEQQKVWIPVSTANTGAIEKRPVWRVTFKLEDTAGRERFDRDAMTVWVTMDGLVSQLSLDTWQAENRRPRP